MTTAEPLVDERVSTSRPSGCRRTIPPKAKLKSLSQLDGRSALVRAARDRKAALVTDLGSDLSTAQLILVDRVALLATFAESCEAAWIASAGELPIDPSYNGAVGQLRHILAQLGLKRVPRPVATLAQHIAAKYSRTVVAQHKEDKDDTA
jgi:hypothetical protein